MPNTRVLMSSARYFSNEQPINPYYHDESVDVAEAKREHELIKQSLQTAGVTVTSVEAPPDSQDGVYTANWALVRGDTALLARLPAARKAEEAWAEQCLQNLGKTVRHVPEDWHFSGQGDALACGDLLFCGRGYRSDERAQAWAAEQLCYTRVQLQTLPQLDSRGAPIVNAASGWPDSFYYDIDLALAIIAPPRGNKKGVIAYCPEAFTPDSQALLASLDVVEKIIVSEQEAKGAFACNLVATETHVVMSDKAPKLKVALESRGYSTITPKITELIKGGGYIRCTSLSFNE